MPLPSRAFDFLVRRRRWVCCAWLGLFALGLAVGLDLVRRSQDLPPAPRGSRADKDKRAFASAFASAANAQPVVVVVSCKDKSKEANCGVACAANSCARKCRGERPDIAAWFRRVSSDVLAFAERQRRDSEAPVISDYLAYYNVSGTHKDAIKCSLASRDGRTTFALFVYDARLDRARKHALLEHVLDVAQSTSGLPSDVKVGVTGSDLVTIEATAASEKNLVRTDAATLPLALALFATMVRSWRLLLLCMLGTAVAVVSSFGILGLVTDVGHMRPLSVLAILTEAVAASMSIDYNLFLHRRFRDEIKNGRGPIDAARVMFEQAGEVAFLSCFTFLSVFVGFLFYKADTFSDFGRVFVVTLVVAFAANVSLSVCLITAYPDFFSKFSFNQDRGGQVASQAPHVMVVHAAAGGSVVSAGTGTGTGTETGTTSAATSASSSVASSPRASNLALTGQTRRNGSAALVLPPHVDLLVSNGIFVSSRTLDDVEEGETEPLAAATAAAAVGNNNRRNLGVTVTGAQRHHRGAPYSGLYFRFIRLTTRFPWNVVWILATYAAIIPLALQAKRIKSNQDFMSIAPRGGYSRRTLDALRDAFDVGMFTPISILVDTRTHHRAALDDDGVPLQEPAQVLPPLMDTTTFDVLTRVSRRISAETGVHRDHFLSPVDAAGFSVSHALARELLNPRSVMCLVDPDPCEMYAWLYSRSVTRDGRAAVIQVNLPMNPFSEEGNEFVRAARRAADDVTNHEHQAGRPSVRVYVSGYPVDAYELMSEAFDSFPTLLAATCVLVAVLLGTGFRSVMVPVRLALTVMLPLLGVFGAAVLVYQDGHMAWTGWVAFDASPDGFFWFIPLCGCFETLGLVLDYDVFTAHRIVEHRADGYALQAAVVKGVWETQSTVVVAGLIMASVFGGLLLSPEPAINQFGFLLLFGVLFDVFVVQALLFPSIASLDLGRASFWPRSVPMEGLITLEDEEFVGRGGEEGEEDVVKPPLGGGGRAGGWCCGCRPSRGGGASGEVGEVDAVDAVASPASNVTTTPLLRLFPDDVPEAVAASSSTSSSEASSSFYS